MHGKKFFDGNLASRVENNFESLKYTYVILTFITVKRRFMITETIEISTLNSDIVAIAVFYRNKAFIFTQ